MQGSILFGKVAIFRQFHNGLFITSPQVRRLAPSRTTDPAYHKISKQNKPKRKKEPLVGCCGCGIIVMAAESDTHDTINGLSHYVCVVLKVMKMLKGAKLPKLSSHQSLQDIQEYLQKQAEYLMRRPSSRWVDRKLGRLNKICFFLMIEPVCSIAPGLAKKNP